MILRYKSYDTRAVTRSICVLLQVLVALMFVLAAGGIHFFHWTSVIFRKLSYAETLHEVLMDAYGNDGADLKGTTIKDLFEFSTTAADQAFHDASQVLGEGTTSSVLGILLFSQYSLIS